MAGTLTIGKSEGGIVLLLYTSVVIGTMALFSLANWFINAKKRYQGPSLPAELT